MDIHDEIELEARNIYEESGMIEGRDLENWFEAEKIVTARHAAEKEEAAVEEEPQPKPQNTSKKKK